MQIALVLLAAGNSVRFGSNKLLHILNGKAMYRHIMDEVAGCESGLFAKKLLVTQYRELADDALGLGYGIVRNTDSRAGISYSIQLAVERLSADRELQGICFAVCDQPYLTGATLSAFIHSWEPSGKGMGCLGSGDVLGNPAVFSRAYFPELLSLTGDTGGKRVIKKHPEDVFVFQVPAKELEDFDQL
jgi:Uncharacterized MobA-related protein